MTILEGKQRIINIDPQRLTWDWHTGVKGDIDQAVACGRIAEGTEPYRIPKLITIGNTRFCIVDGCSKGVRGCPTHPQGTRIRKKRFSYGGTKIQHQGHHYVLGYEWIFSARHRTLEETRYHLRCTYGHGGAFLTCGEPIDTEDETYREGALEWIQPRKFPSYHYYLRRDHYRQRYHTMNTTEAIHQQAVDLELLETPDFTNQEDMQTFLDQGPITTAPQQLQLI